MSLKSPSEKRTHFIKPNRYSEVPLNPVLVAHNKLIGKETTLILDTNVVIAMEKVAKGKGNLKNYKLHNLIYLLQNCPVKSIAISPGEAFSEMPPALAEESRVLYEIFCAKHLPNFIDVPGVLHSEFKGKRTDYGFDDVVLDYQRILSLHYASIIHLNLIYQSPSDNPIDNFQRYLHKIIEELDVVSAMELEIARYCFAPPIKTSKKLKTNKIRNDVTDNFTTKKRDEILHTAFNGASDILLLQNANRIDMHGLDGVPQDCWIATHDENLVAFSEIFHHFGEGKNIGRFASIESLPEQDGVEYWEETARISQENSLMRLDKANERADEDLLDKLHAAARRAQDLVRSKDE